MMKSCRDCVHYKPCQEWAIDCYHGNTMFPYEAETGEEICEHYTPIADVVPKSESDMLHYLLKDAWKRIEELDNLCGELQKAKTEATREIFEEIGNIMERYLDSPLCNYHKIRIDFAELKKKYTER